ncbi:glycosyltransferase family 4 protein [PVC group bacterium]|nr:glycosyltransferase family 4 protein [PVC group bacterium]
MDPTIKSKQQRIAILTSKADSLTNFRGPLIGEWISRGLNVYALAPDFDDESRNAVLALGAIPTDVHMSRTGRNPIADLWSIISLVFLFRKLKLDMVFCYYIKPVVYGMLAARIARVRRRYALVAGAGYMYSDSSSKNIRHRMLRSAVNWMCKRGLRSANMVFFQNQDDLELFHKLGIVNYDLTFLTGGTGVDLRRYSQVQPNTSPTTFILVARLLIEKGIREFAQASREVKENHNNTRFILLGGLDPNPNGLDVEEISAWVDEGVLEWPGEVKDVYSWLQKSSVFVLPSYREGVPRSTQEAMATGLPVITCDTVGCRETVIDGETGLLIAPRDVPSLASAMMHFVENPEEIARMGNAGREFSEERFDVKKINKKILQSMGIK